MDRPPQLAYKVTLKNIFDDSKTQLDGILILDKIHWNFSCKDFSFTMEVLYSMIEHISSYISNDTQESDKPQKDSLGASVNSIKSVTSASPTAIFLKCKNLRMYTICCKDSDDTVEIVQEMTRLFTFDNLTRLPCFDIFTMLTNEDKKADIGWDVYNMEYEYNRMSFTSKKWIKTFINEGFKLCPTYPETLYVPAGTTNNIIFGSSKFRSKRRFPVLSYYHEPSKGSICRSSQPLVGISKKSKEDIMLLYSISKVAESSDKMVIVDTRPMINAVANKAAGKGFEDSKNYPFCNFYFSGIENIHVMRESYQKLFSAIHKKHDTYLTYSNALESSGWLKHIQSILDTSIFIAKTILNGTNVLVHCSDGWDRTSQTCALASLLLDPFYRTIHGFIVLIEKDFLSFGHKFQSRYGHLSGDSKNVSPIFIQFLDCVWQIMRQFPSCFQFNEKFLLNLAEHIFSCEYGTFLCDSQEERIKNKLRKSTKSLWSLDMKQFINHLMSTEPSEKQVFPQTGRNFLKIWMNCYGESLFFPNYYNSNEVYLDSLVNLKDYLRHYNNTQNSNILDLWAFPNYLKTECDCGKLYDHKTTIHVNCWKCFKQKCSKCIKIVDQQRTCEDCLIKIESVST